MQKLFTTLAACLVAANTFAQTVNGVLIKDIEAEYIQVVGTNTGAGAMFSTDKSRIEIDFGQKQKGWSRNDTYIKDAEGNYLKFESMIDAVNFMAKFGFEVVTAYQLEEKRGVGGIDFHPVFLMRRKPNTTKP